MMTMKFRNLSKMLLALAIILSSFSFVPTTTHAATGKIFLMGGAVSDNNATVYHALKAAAGGTTPTVAIFCSGAASYAIAYDAYTNDIATALSYKNLFLKYGFKPVFIPIAVDNYATEAYNQANIDLVNSAQVIFFNGGDQARHARSLLQNDGTDTPLMAAVRNRYNAGAVIAGTSAGTAVQGNPMYGEGIPYGYLKANKLVKKLISDVTLKDPSNIDNGGYTNGFGFVDNAVVDTHFDARGRLGRLVVAQRDLNKPFGIGVDEDTAFYVNGDVGTAYGTNGVFVLDKASATYPTATYFKASNLRLTYLTSGDSFRFSTKAVTSTKSLITSPYYTTYYDSTDIFKAYETTKVLTRLVDTQISSTGYLYGDTYESNPRFTLKFYKNTSTKGYYSNGKYTVVNASVDVY